MPVRVSIAINPLKTAELQQHKPTVSLPPVDSSVKTEVTSLSGHYRDRWKSVPATEMEPMPLLAESLIRKLQVWLDSYSRDRPGINSFGANTPISKFSIKLYFPNFPCGSHDVPFLGKYLNSAWFWDAGVWWGGRGVWQTLDTTKAIWDFALHCWLKTDSEKTAADFSISAAKVYLNNQSANKVKSKCQRTPVLNEDILKNAH